MPRGWPPLELRELQAILKALGFHYSHHEGGHAFWKGVRGGVSRKVTVDEHVAPFDEFLLKSMCSQAGCDRKAFYGATKASALKIGLRPPKTEGAV